MKSKQAPKLTINQDGKVYDLYNLPKDFVIKGSLDLSGKGLTELPDLSTVVVCGEFNCSFNELTNLKGAPQEAIGGFNCFSNLLTSLEGAPKHVGWFDCQLNKLINLEGAPKECDGFFDCRYNKLKSLSGAPNIIGSYFDCSHNELTSLEGGPKRVEDMFMCGSNHLKTLEGAPREVGGAFICDHNRLESLKGIPAKCAFKDIFASSAMQTYAVNFSNNMVLSLQYLPEIPERLTWFCGSNPLRPDITNVPDYVFANIKRLVGVESNWKKELMSRYKQRLSKQR